MINDKEKGGLGIGSLRALNLALLGSWCLEASWKNMVTNRYGASGRLLGRGSNRRVNGDWKIIVGIRKDLEKLGISPDDLWHQIPFSNEWRWRLEDHGRFSVVSMRRLIGSKLLIDSVPLKWWNRL